jgi:DNA modification methylase
MNRTYSLSPDATLFHADCRDALRALPDNCLDSCVSDPPYALVSIVKRFGAADAAPARSEGATGVYKRASAGFMGKQWDTGEVAFDVEFWADVWRVLKPGAFVVAFGASRGYHRLACAIEDAGFEIRDSLMWIYGTGFPKSHDVSKGIDQQLGAQREVLERRKVAVGFDTEKQGGGGWSAGEVVITAPATDAAREWEGWGTALKPAFEPIVLARKPLSEGTVAANVLKWRTGALNIGACRIGNEPRTNAPAGNKPGGNSYNMSVAGMPDDAVGREVAGRWPANVVHDGSAEVIEAFPARAWQLLTHHKRAGKQNIGTFEIRDRTGEHANFGGDSGSAARFFYSAKASKADRAGSKHPTVKPVSLMQWLCRLVTPPGGVVLDPFAGSGTTGAAAVLEGFRVVLCEREAEYVRDICARFDPNATHTHTHTGPEGVREIRKGRTIGPIGLKR